jgi:Galactosyltransferase
MPYFNSVEECQQIVARDLKSIPDKFKNFTKVTWNNKAKNPWRRMVVGVVTCKKYEKRLNNFLILFEDIFAQLGLDFYMIYADPDLETANGDDYLVDHENRIFIAKANESYETLAHKLAIFYSYIYNHTDYDYVIKADDGCLLNLKEVISKLDKPYVGATLKPTLNTIHKGKCSNKEYNKINLDFGHEFKRYNPQIEEKLYQELYHINLAGGGYGYRLSREAIGKIVKYKSHVLSLGLTYEDVLLGQMLYIEGVRVTRVGIGRYHYIGPRK